MKKKLYTATLFDAMKDKEDVVEVEAYSEEQARFLLADLDVVNIEETVKKKEVY